MMAARRREWVEQARAADLDDLLRRHGVTLSGRAGWLAGPCPVCGGTDRFAVHLRKRAWRCRGCGVGGGDAISLAQHIEGLDFMRAVESVCGEPPPRGGETEPDPERERRRARAERDRRAREAEAREYDRRQREKARWLWSASEPATGTIVEPYLRSRSISVPPPGTMRFLPPHKPEHHPAMLVPYGIPEEPEPGTLTIAKAAISAVHLTLLKPDGSGKIEVEKPNSPKITVGSPSGQPLVLAPMNDLMGLAINEGIEDALSVHEATGLGVWAAGSAGFMPALADVVPAYVEVVHVMVDDNPNGRRNSAELVRRLRARGFAVVPHLLRSEVAA